MTRTIPWTRPEIIALLTNNDRAVEKAILRLYSAQTSAEQQNRTTTDHNNRGFNAASANVGSYLARWLLAYDGRRLSGKWLIKGRKIALRHVKQLLAHANRPFANQRQLGHGCLRLQNQHEKGG
jgi:hypothetical protein